MKMTIPKLKNVIRQVILESMTPAQTAEEELVFDIAVKLMYTDYRTMQQVADKMSNGRYSSDPSFKQLVDDTYEMLEREASGP